MSRTFAQVSALFDCLAETEIHERLVWDAHVHRFSAALSTLGEGIGKDDPLRPLLRRLNRLRFDLMAAPVSPQAVGSEAAHAQFRKDRVRIEAAFPHLQSALTETLGALEALSERRANPLLDALMATFAHGLDGMRVALVLLAESRLLEPAQRAAVEAGFDNFQWMTPPELRRANRMERLIVLGAPRWFPDHVFTAPRAPEIHVVRYRWIAADWERVRGPTFVVAGSDKQALGRRLVIHRDRSSTGLAMPITTVEELDLLPRLDLDDLPRGGGSDPAGSGDDEVDAVALMLEGDDFVLMEGGEGRRAWIVDLDQDKPVRNVPVEDLTAGVFVLLRTEGGGDYVAEVADRVLGDHARPTREAQRRWKSRLRAAVREGGRHAVITELQRLGSPSANDSNLRNWLSPRNIKTRDRADFDAILALVGLDGEGDAIWRQMAVIDKAHKAAGQVIRKQLMAEVLRTDPRELLRHGRLDFELDQGGGALTAFRVVAVAAERRRVPRNRLDRVLSAIAPAPLL